MKPTHWIEVNGEPLEVDWRTWGAWFEDIENRKVARTTFGDLDVSTVFLGIDHRFGDGPPLLYETMIFATGTANDVTGFQERYATRAQALARHDELVEALRSGWKPGADED